MSRWLRQRRNLPLWCPLFLTAIFVPSAGTGGQQGGTAGAAAGRPAAERPAAAVAIPTYVNLRRLPAEVTLATLSNGLTVIVQENHAAPLCTVRCFVRNTGSAFEGRYLGAGISHVLEHVTAGGSTTRRTEKEIERLINRFGGATNAFTSAEMTSYFIDCPARQTPLAIDLLADAMQHVKFAPAEFARELKVVKQELADGEVNRRQVQWSLLQQTLYTVHPARHPIVGYLDVLEATTNEAIVDFYRDRYVPNNQVFIVVGDVKTEEVLAQVARQWAGTPRGRETFVALPDEPPQLSPREAVREMDGTMYDLALAWPTVKISDPDMYPLDLAAYVLAEGESSRLVRRLKYEQQLVLSVSSASHTPHFVHGFFVVLASAAPQQWQSAQQAILAEVERLRNDLIGPEELARAKKQKAAELIIERQTVKEAADNLGRSFIATGDPLFEEMYVQQIQQVTAEQVRQAARRYLVPERLNRVVIAPPGGAPKPPAEHAGDGRGEILREQLPNGLRVLLRRQANLPLVNIQAWVLAGSLVESEATAGRSHLLAAMLDKGTARHSAEEIAGYFDAIGGKLSFGAGRFTVRGSATVLRDDFPQAAALFAECFTQPAFPRANFDKAQALALAAIAHRADNAEAEALDLFYDSLPASSPYHLLQEGKTASLQRLTAADLRAYHAQYFVPNNMLVTVFGDIEPPEALKLVKQHFGRLKPNAELKPFDFQRSNAIPKPLVRHKQTGKQTGMIVLGYPGPSLSEKEDFAALTLLDAVLSGYRAPSGWLFTELRGEGLVYFVDAVRMAGPSPGYLAILAQTRPEKLDEVVGRIRRNIERAVAGKIDEEEFQTVVQMVVAMHAQENTTIADQARQAAVDELYGLGYDYEKTFDARIQAVKKEDLARVAKKYLRNYVLVTTSPEKK